MKQPNQLLQIIAINIRNERNKLSISQEKLAELAGLHRTYVGQIERAEKNLTVTSLERVAKALNINIKNLL